VQRASLHDKRFILGNLLDKLHNRPMSSSRYTLRQLEAFVTAAELLSFTSAADRLALSPSAVSQLVVELESSLGFKLFVRSTRKVSLSAEGKEFYASAQTVLKHLHLAEVAATDLRNRASGLVRIAAPMVIASTILPPLIRDYTLDRPKIVVRIRDAAVEQLTDVVASGEVDLAIGPDRPGSDAVHHTPLFSSPWVLWCAPGHPLATRPEVQWADVRAHTLVTAGRDHEISVAQMGVALPEAERIRPREVVDHISTAFGIAAAGLAATVSPAYVQTWAKRQGLVMRRIVDPEVVRQVCLYQSAHRTPSPATTGFAEYLVAALKKPQRKRHGR
jgi:DNA-binding transcriptional LysR family regulator